MVLYALVSDTSIGFLFLGGFVQRHAWSRFMIMNSIIAAAGLSGGARFHWRNAKITVKAFPH